MSPYNHILVAADLVFSDDEVVARRAAELANACGAKVSLIHILELYYTYEEPWQPENTADARNQLIKAALEGLDKLAKAFDIAPERQHVCIGHVRDQILQTAEAHQVDLIVVGSHSRHGLKLLLDSTASQIIKQTSCDVLSIRIPTSHG